MNKSVSFQQTDKSICARSKSLLNSSQETGRKKHVRPKSSRIETIKRRKSKMPNKENEGEVLKKLYKHKRNRSSCDDTHVDPKPSKDFKSQIERVMEFDIAQNEKVQKALCTLFLAKKKTQDTLKDLKFIQKTLNKR